MRSSLTLLALPVLALLAFGCAAPAGEEASETGEDAVTRAQCRARPENDPECRIEGVLEQMVVAEFDPFVVGDACATFVKVGNRRYGLMRDEGACWDANRYENAQVKVSFNKGALTLVSGEKREILKRYDASAIYYDFAGTLKIDPPPTPEPADLAAFDALTPDQKVDALYETRGDWGVLRPGYAEKSIRILDTIPAGPAQRAALDAYYDLREHSFSNGGDKPDVYAVQKDGVTYAYAMAASGNYWGGDWGEYVVFDREFEELARFSWSE